MDQKNDQDATYNGRTVSQLATMFESKIREKVRSSPYLRHYQKFAEPKLSPREISTEKHPPSVTKSVTLPIKVQPFLPENCPVRDEKATLKVSSIINESEADNLPCSSAQGKSGSELKLVQARQNSTGGSLKSKKYVQGDFKRDVPSSDFQRDVPSSDFQRDATLPDSTIPKALTKHKRSKSLTTSFQRLLRREKRLGSLDGSSDGQKGASNDSIRNIGASADKNNGLISTPKLSFTTRKKSADDGKGELNRKPMRRKSGRFREFFRAKSLNSIADSKSNSIFASDGLLCSKCKETETMPRKVFSLERFNSLKDERDVLQNERDRAVEEWSHAAKRWEQMLDDMDSLMSELIQVRADRDDKRDDIREMMSDYEDELKIREANYESLEADFAELEDQLQVAKKERIDALSEYDKLLKRNYDISKELEKSEDMNLELRSCVSVSEQDIATLNQQVESLQEERDHALELWDASVEERKKLHQEMESLIHSRDLLLRKTFQQSEEINALRKSRDTLQRAVDSTKENGQKELKGLVREAHNHVNIQERTHLSQNGHETDNLQFDHFCMNDDDDIPEFIELAVSLERLDSKYGIRVDTAVDEPKVMVVHVGAHAASLSNIRKYDRLLSINGVSVVRSDKKAVEKIIRDCPGRLTMVLRRENPAFAARRTEDIDLLIPKASNRQNRDLGLICKIQVSSIDEDSSVGGLDKIKPGDFITKINTQDISKVFEAVLYKISKKQGGKLSMRLQRREEPKKCGIEGPHVLHEHFFNYHQKIARSASNISQSSNHSITSNNSEHTYRTAYTDDNESIFSGSLAPSIIVHPCNEFDDGDILSLPGTSRKISSQYQEIDYHQEEALSAGESSQNATPSRHGHSNQSGSHQRPGRKYSDARSLRSLKTVSSARINKQQLRRVRSDMSDHSTTTSGIIIPDDAKNPVRVLMPVEENDGANEMTRNSWLLPSPERPRIEDRRGRNSVSVFATLPRQKKKSVNEADCNKRTTHRVLRLEKAGMDPLGFDVCGGNKVGIFVKEVKDGSMAALGGMKVGDRILYINSYDLHCATLDYATRIVLRSEKLTNFRIEVKYEERFKDSLKEVPHDSLYVRTLRHFDSDKDGYLQFGVGEILLVTNTFVNYNKANRMSWQWFAQKVSRNSNGEQGVIPRLESFSDHDEIEESKTMDDNGAVTKGKLQSTERKKAKRSASDVKKWLMRKPSINKKKKDKDSKGTEKVNRSPYYEILWDN